MRKLYPSDLTDDQWAIIEPLIPVKTTGRPRRIAKSRFLDLSCCFNMIFATF